MIQFVKLLTATSDLMTPQLTASQQERLSTRRKPRRRSKSGALRCVQVLLKLRNLRLSILQTRTRLKALHNSLMQSPHRPSYALPTCAPSRICIPSLILSKHCRYA